MEEEEVGVDEAEEADEEDAVEEAAEVAAVVETRTHCLSRVELDIDNDYLYTCFFNFIYLFTQICSRPILTSLALVLFLC